MSLQRRHFYDFGDFRLDFTEKVLARDGKFISLTPKVFETLCVLIENAGRLIEKHELMQRIWQDRSVLADGQTVNSFRLNDTKSKSTELSWMLDGKSLAYVATDGKNDGKFLWLQSFDKEAPERIADLGDETVNSLAFSPDGRQLALVRGTWNHDAVLIKGLK